jgi:8-oxo-dGTP pyrophosphatase MutT (NUDIX family)
MPISDYLRGVRAKVGHDFLLASAATGLVFDDAGRVLLARHSNAGLWVAPGGGIDPDESPADAVVRELWEETGLHVEPITLLGVFGGPSFRVHYANGDETGYVMVVFECRILGGTLTPDGEEILELRWVAAGELGDIPLSRWARDLLPTLVASRGRTLIPPVSWRPPSGERGPGGLSPTVITPAGRGRGPRRP